MNKSELKEQLRLTPEEITGLVWKRAGEWNEAVEKCFMIVTQAQLNKALNHPITRPCKECKGKKEVVVEKIPDPQVTYRYKHYEQIPCPTCTVTGQETTTSGKLAEEWLKC